MRQLIFWQIFRLIGSCLHIWVKIVIFLASFKMHPTHESISETPTPPPTDHFLWLGIEAIEGFSGKITFSNKWWWTLDKKNIVSSSFFSLSPPFSPPPSVCICSVLHWEGADLQVSSIWILSRSLNHALIAFWSLNENRVRYISVCLWVVWLGCCFVWKPISARKGLVLSIKSDKNKAKVKRKATVEDFLEGQTCNGCSTKDSYPDLIENPAKSH